MNTVWVLVNVYQSDLAYVHLGDSVRNQHGRLSRTFHGKISYIAPALDPTTRTLQARIVTENPGKKLKSDMYVTAPVMPAPFPMPSTVPDAAVLRDTENQPFVYVQTENKTNSRAASSLSATATRAARKSPPASRKANTLSATAACSCSLRILLQH